MNTHARNLLLDVVRNPYCWPGGYEKLLVTHDDALICSECALKEARRIMSDIRDNYGTGWLPQAVTYEAVPAECTAEHDLELLSNCAHCGREFGELGC